MLDSVTKKNIDDCRDVLVGKVPDPKSQIEQITLALIYKFMDDMDREAVEKYKGKAKFFTGDHEKYSWRKLFSPALSGKDLIDLYAEALDKLNTNPNIPELFRNIFKNAYLPYRDPATLKLFLKHISDFTYDHSERLGDAFEYLLSVMGSQGDAGQFRTPRNIIDFITACVNPQKHETVADPACGTSGFLLSAYKHILKQNTKAGKLTLTPDEKKKLSTNFTGYDISPDMVRLSLANMFLHDFKNPQIYEYDSLSSEERWNETFDVILANPPFMTPKGGIRPHKKFGVQANKAEVLFTDYIAEHLNPKGRAGIVVPNGIVATTQTAYTQLRRLLVTDSLIAVVSLPAGCFNPYSGVKTSVLLLDKQLTKKAKHVLFIKVANDGFDLGAQRREIDRNDLPLALEAFEAYKTSIANDTPFDIAKYSSICLLVEKEKILANKDVVLSGDRYKEGKDFYTEFEKVKLVNVLDYEQPTKYIVDSVDYDDSYKTPVLTAGKTFILGYTNEEYGIYKADLPVIIFDDFTTATKFVDFPFKVKSSAMKILKAKQGVADIRFLYYLMQKIEFNSSEHKRYWISQYSQIEIPLPPIEIQEQIVAEIEALQKVMDGCKMVLDNYKPDITIKPEWELVELGEVCDFISGYAFSSKDFTPKQAAKSIKITNVGVGDFIEVDDDYLPLDFLNIYPKFSAREGDIAIALTRTIISTGIKVCRVPKSYDGALVNQRVAIIKAKENLTTNSFLYLLLTSNETIEFVREESKTLMQPNLSIRDLSKLKVKLPPIAEQNAIVQAIENEQRFVAANKELLALFEQKIKAKISAVWGVTEEVEA